MRIENQSLVVAIESIAEIGNIFKKGLMGCEGKTHTGKVWKVESLAE